MATRTTKKSADVPTPADDVEALYHALLQHFYGRGDRNGAEPVAQRLEAALREPAVAASIRGEEIRSLLAELRNDLPAAIRCREAEIRKILELHSLAVNSPSWDYVARQYDFSDVSDRLDLLAMLYEAEGDRDRALAILEESQAYCASHRVKFEGQHLLDDLQQEQPIGRSTSRGLKKAIAVRAAERRK